MQHWKKTHSKAEIGWCWGPIKNNNIFTKSNQEKRKSGYNYIHVTKYYSRWFTNVLLWLSFPLAIDYSFELEKDEKKEIISLQIHKWQNMALFSFEHKNNTAIFVPFFIRPRINLLIKWIAKTWKNNFNLFFLYYFKLNTLHIIST